MLVEYEKSGSEIGLNYLVDILRGKKSGDYKKIRPDLVTKYLGLLKNKVEK